ncbi:MAG: MATE family efflux transporter [Methanophagales archaeon ANME-1-THS]|nr:MAG: MATE family efflux transporter [Methanophagales archaeon ANME-1-THS]
MNHTASGNSLPGTSGYKQTEGVKTLVGDPKRAIRKLALPMIVAMSVQTIYNIVDAIWVSGLGPDALAAVGFVFPFFFMITALATGLGIGSGSAISRRIGAEDKLGADNVAVNTIAIMVIIAAIFSIPLFIFAEQILLCMGCGEILVMAVEYGRILFAGTVLILFTQVANAILRAEGDATRAMYALMLGAGLNIVLDPLFIYTLGFGVAGAAWATLLAMAISAALMLNWLFIKKDTFVSFTFHRFRFNPHILKDIFNVGIPSSVQQLSISFTMLILNLIIVGVASTDGVAVYSTGWRVVTIAILPLLGIASAVVPVTGAAFGARSYERLNTSYMYAIRIGISIEIVVAVATFVLAPWITAVFTTAEGGVRIAADLELFFKIVCLFYPGAALGIISSSLFQGTGKGLYSLIVTLLRTIVLTPLLAVVFASIIGIGLVGIWWGLVAANLLGSIVAFTWGKLYIRSLHTAFTTG